MSISSSGARWYVVQCRTGQDLRASEHLARQGFICFRPALRTHQPRQGYERSCAESLLPGYVFIRFDLFKDNWRAVRFTRGVRCIVSFGEEPLPIADNIVAAIQDRCMGVAKESPGKAEHSSTAVKAMFTSNTCEQRIAKLLSLLQRP